MAAIELKAENDIFTDLVVDTDLSAFGETKCDIGNILSLSVSPTLFVELVVDVEIIPDP